MLCHGPSQQSTTIHLLLGLLLFVEETNDDHLGFDSPVPTSMLLYRVYTSRNFAFRKTGVFKAQGTRFTV